MNDLLADTRFWFTTFGAAIVGFMRYLWGKQEKRLEALERDSVRRAEFERLRADLRDEHEENSKKLDKIDATGQSLKEALGQIRTDIAVLQDRQGDALFDDAGRIRR